MKSNSRNENYVKVKKMIEEEIISCFYAEKNGEKYTIYYVHSPLDYSSYEMELDVLKDSFPFIMVLNLSRNFDYSFNEDEIHGVDVLHEKIRTGEISSMEEIDSFLIKYFREYDDEIVYWEEFQQHYHGVPVIGWWLEDMPDAMWEVSTAGIVIVSKELLERTDEFVNIDAEELHRLLKQFDRVNGKLIEWSENREEDREEDVWFEPMDDDPSEVIEMKKNRSKLLTRISSLLDKEVEEFFERFSNIHNNEMYSLVIVNEEGEKEYSGYYYGGRKDSEIKDILEKEGFCNIEEEV